jgi:hypothetical protein
VRDPRIKRTRQLLQEALRKLLQTKPFDEILVQDPPFLRSDSIQTRWQVMPKRGTTLSLPFPGSESESDIG